MCLVAGCLKRSKVSPPSGRDESDFLVPGEWRRDAPSPAQGDDLCGQGRLRAHAAGTAARVHLPFSVGLEWITSIDWIFCLIKVPQCGQTARGHQLWAVCRWAQGEGPGQLERGERLSSSSRLFSSCFIHFLFSGSRGEKILPLIQ